MMKNIGILLIVLFNSVLFAQNGPEDSTSVEVDPNAPIKNWTFKSAPKVIKFSPLDIFSVIPTFGIDVETRLPTGKNSLQVGLGLIPNAFQLISGENLSGYDWMGGYKVRTEGRLYMPEKQTRYIGVGLSMRHLVIKDEFAVGMEPFEGNFGQTNFAYFVNTPMTFNRFTIDLSVKYGAQYTTRSNLVVDVYFGLQLRSLRVHSNSAIPSGGEIPQQQRGMWELRDNKKLSYPLPIVGIKLGFNR